MGDSKFAKLLDEHGRITDVCFAEVPPPNVLAGETFISFAVEAQAFLHDYENHVSIWGISQDCEDYWPGRIAPLDQQDREEWYMRGIIRSYRRSFPDLLTWPSHEVAIGLSSASLFAEVSGDVVIDRLESEVERHLVDWHSTRSWLSRLAVDESDAYVVGSAVAGFDWTTYESLVRPWKDAHDERLRRVYRDLELYHGALASIEPIHRDAPTDHDRRFERLIILGNAALGSIAKARAAGISFAISTGATERNATPPWPQDRAVHVRALQIKNLRCVQSLDLSFTCPEGQTQGQWLVFLGENGTGKTTLLRAIALALEPPEIARLHLSRFTRDAPLLGRDPQDAHVALTYGESQLSIIGLEADLASTNLVIRSAPVARPLVLGYGCGRGSALGGPSRESKPSPVEGADTLFDDNAYLIHADTWLRDLMLLNGQNSRLYDAVTRLLQKIIGVEALSLEGNTTCVEVAGVGQVPLASLSHGYLTTLGWVADFLARFVQYAQASGYAMGESFQERIPATVLIDELDLHLHPTWQREVISKLRATFPMTTFIATTHSPLTLHGCRAEEIVILQVNDDGESIAFQPDISPAFKTGSELYESFFGIDRYLPADLDDALFEYATLAGNPSRTDDDEERRLALLTRLESAGVRPMKAIARESE